ncbi:Tf2-6, partial [Mucuna pruriens]
MRLALEIEAKRLTVKSDSKLVTGQVNGEYQAKDPKLAKYWERAMTMAASFDNFTLLHVPKDQNERADLLAKLASIRRRRLQRSVIHENISAPTIDRPEIQHNERRETWMDPIIEYLKNRKLPDDSAGSLKVRKEAPKYTLIKQRLYRRGFSSPLLKCVDFEEASHLRDAYRGTSTGRKDRPSWRFADNRQAPPEQLHTVVSPWPFHKWGIDILGPFPLAPGQVKFLMVAMDYFTKWIEAEPMATITAERVKRFIRKKIICRIGLLAEEIVSDNEAANRVILRGLRRRLEEAKGRWVEELPQVIWSYHTTPHSTTGEIPFRLTYGSEAMIPVEIGEPSPRTALFEPTANEEELRANLDLLQEVREIAHIREYAAKTRVARKYNQKVVYRDFEEGDLVMRKMNLGVGKNKLTPRWEEPFMVIEKVGKGAYRLEHLDKRRIPCTWNTNSLRSTECKSNERDQRQLKLQDTKRTAIETDLGSEELKLQDPKQTAIETDPGSEELKLQDPKRTAIETNPGSEELKLQDPKRMVIETDPRSEELKSTKTILRSAIMEKQPATKDEEINQISSMFTPTMVYGRVLLR